MSRRAMIFGMTGQDGPYLAELLLRKGYEVHGVVRRPRVESSERFASMRHALTFHQADVLDHHSIFSAVQQVEPDEIYNLAAQSFIPASWTHPVLTMEYTAAAVIGILEAIRTAGLVKKTRYFQASSSEVFAGSKTSPQNEQTPFSPLNPYGSAKVYAQCITENYRRHYGMYCVTGILFNHESPYRGIEFVTRKTTDAAARIKLGMLESLELGNLDSSRDWGFAGDYVRGMWLALQPSEPLDYVFGTGITHTVQELVEIAFSRLGLDPSRSIRVRQDLVRVETGTVLCADASRARTVLNWKPEVGFRDLIEMMVDRDYARLSRTKGT
ncbi:GDP-mannose 4,6-dehydratase [bacterium]|nr:GDP-mannose 4,6-dehydratase [bacterium]